jgi:hypothetical protein
VFADAISQSVKEAPGRRALLFSYHAPSMNLFADLFKRRPSSKTKAATTDRAVVAA